MDPLKPAGNVNAEAGAPSFTPVILKPLNTIKPVTANTGSSHKIDFFIFISLIVFDTQS
jgi:hypothetical protein